MTAIPGVNQKVQEEAVAFRSAVSESIGTAMGGAINYCLTQIGSLGMATTIFAGPATAGATTSYTWKAPNDLPNGPYFTGQLFLIGQGGAGGGAGANTALNQGGGGTNPCLIVVNSIIAGTTYSISVGGGGAGGGVNSFGNDGAITSFASAFSFPAGKGGYNAGAATTFNAPIAGMGATGGTWGKYGNDSNNIQTGGEGNIYSGYGTGGHGSSSAHGAADKGQPGLLIVTYLTRVPV